jgi:FAD/FMN-containing dehydrogenase/Fe-S oxidoreductase
VRLTTTADAKDLLVELSQNVSGEVRFDSMSRQLYSTDASIYQIEPIGVVLPRNADDVAAVIEITAQYRIPVVSRGGGTSLAGQTLGHGVVIDFSKYMRDLVEINSEERWVRTQPGIILDELNLKLRHLGLEFAPDPSTSNRGNVGGALGNNSCGAHSIVWGKTSDNVIALKAVLSNGDMADLGSLDGEGLQSKFAQKNLEGAIYRQLNELMTDVHEEVEARYPKILRRVSGYNLDNLGINGFDMARFVVGSEGTLVAITEAKLKLVPIPKHKALAVIHFKEMLDSMEATVTTLEEKPAAVELIGSMILRQAKTNLEYARMTDFIDGDPEAVLVVEVTADDEDELESKLDNLENRMKSEKHGYAFKRLVAIEDQFKVWAVRKAGLGLMMNVTGNYKPLPFVEDTAVAPEALPQYVRRFEQIIHNHDTTAGYYGHASVGCLHIRPLLNLKDQAGVDKMVSIASDVSDLVLEFGGAMSGEHGDGLVRSIWNEKMFGPVIYDAFRQVKRAFDPKGIMNPGKIVDPPPMTENLRMGPEYNAIKVQGSFAYPAEGSYVGAIEACNGQGACRKVAGGTMCPSYMVTRDEEHSTRGRANALRGVISGALPIETWTGSRLHKVMDLCLECKGCKAECPSNVDVAKLKYEFLNRYHKVNGYSLRDRIFGDIATLSRLGSFFAPVSNWAIRSQTVRDLLERKLGVDRRRVISPFAIQTFTQWFRARRHSRPDAKYRGDVVLFPDTFTNYNYPEIGKAATKVLEHLGFRVIVPPPKCCGRPMLSKGMMDKARLNAKRNVEAVLPFIKNGARLVGLEPSCILTFGDDYVDLLNGDSDAVEVAQSTMLIEEFFLEAQQDPNLRVELSPVPGTKLVSGHCHQKALVGMNQTMGLLSSIPECEATEIQSGCCGMAGSFGFEKEHYDTSLAIGELSLFPAIRSQKGEFQIITQGVSCRQQIEHGTGQRAVHLAEVLAQAL